MLIEIKKNDTLGGDTLFKIYTNGAYYDMFRTEQEALDLVEVLKANLKSGRPTETVIHTITI
jgi:hypothetical protein